MWLPSRNAPSTTSRRSRRCRRMSSPPFASYLAGTAQHSLGSFSRATRARPAARPTGIRSAGRRWCRTIARGTARSAARVATGGSGIAHAAIAARMASVCRVSVAALTGRIRGCSETGDNRPLFPKKARQITSDLTGYSHGSPGIRTRDQPVMHPTAVFTAPAVQGLWAGLSLRPAKVRVGAPAV